MVSDSDLNGNVLGVETRIHQIPSDDSYKMIANL